MTIAEQIVQAKEDYDAVFDAGKKAEYDAFWDAYQDNGNANNYMRAFSNVWDDVTFKPKYNIISKSAEQIFYCSNITDLKGILESRGVILDVSKATLFGYSFALSKITRIPTIDCSSATELEYTFFRCPSLKSIDKLVVTETITFPSTFGECTALENITFEGTIANDINFKSCKRLTLASLINILNHLKDFTGTGEEYTRTLTLSQASVDILNEDNPSWIASMLGAQKKWNLTVV